MDDQVTQGMLFIFRYNMLAFFVAVIPWVGAIADQLSHRGLMPQSIGQIIIVSGLGALLLMVLIFGSIYIDKRNPRRQILPILFTMFFSSALSLLLAILTYLFI